MYKKCVLISSALLVLFSMFAIIRGYFVCKVEDKEAIQIAKIFYKNMEIKYSSEPFITNKSLTKLIVFGSGSKLVMDGDSNSYKLLTSISCKNKEITHFENRELLYLNQSKFTVTLDNRQVLKWPPFIPEQRAKEILLSLSNRIGIPHDVEYSDIRLDKNSGLWTAMWKRKSNGIVYEDDYIAISIMAVDGEFYGFTKWLKGEPCSTEVKVSRAEAIEVAHKEFADFFTKAKWDKNKDKFEVKSAELKIVQDNSFWKRTLSQNIKSRLAWVVVYDTKKGMDKDTVGILRKDESIVRIDAATKKILSSEINVVP